MAVGRALCTSCSPLLDYFLLLDAASSARRRRLSVARRRLDWWHHRRESASTSHEFVQCISPQPDVPALLWCSITDHAAAVHPSARKATGALLCRAIPFLPDLLAGSHVLPIASGAIRRTHRATPTNMGHSVAGCRFRAAYGRIADIRNGAPRSRSPIQRRAVAHVRATTKAVSQSSGQQKGRGNVDAHCQCPRGARSRNTVRTPRVDGRDGSLCRHDGLVGQMVAKANELNRRDGKKAQNHHQDHSSARPRFLGNRLKRNVNESFPE